jgi:hypothetical protein
LSYFQIYLSIYVIFITCTDALLESNNIALFGKNTALSFAFTTSFSTSSSFGNIPSYTDLELNSVNSEKEEKEILNENNSGNDQKMNEKYGVDAILEKEKDIFDQIEVRRL